jgi:hypothetical protein
MASSKRSRPLPLAVTVVVKTVTLVWSVTAQAAVNFNDSADSASAGGVPATADAKAWALVLRDQGRRLISSECAFYIKCAFIEKYASHTGMPTMQIITATEIKNKLGDLFDAVERDEYASVLIERNRRPAAMLLNAQVAEKAILGAYAHGVLPRAVAMRQLGLDWYGDLLQRMNAHGIERPSVSAEDARAMQHSADEVLAVLDATTASASPSDTVTR